jgi:hypothetical protein
MRSIRIASLLCALLCANVSSARANHMALKQTIDITTSVFPVACVASDGRVLGVIGTGFFVNRLGDFVTARHVLEYAMAAQNRRAAFSFGMCRSDAAGDIATCRTSRNPFGILSRLSAVRLLTPPNATQASVAYCGFPLNHLRPQTHRGVAEPYEMRANRPMLMIHTAAQPGASGSPVYLSDGDVIGMVIIAGTMRFAGTSLAEPAELIRLFLLKQSIPI